MGEAFLQRLYEQVGNAFKSLPYALKLEISSLDFDKTEVINFISKSILDIGKISI